MTERVLADSDVLAERIAALDQPHMAPLNDYAARLRESHGDVPHFDPFDGGIAARLLVLLETPGPSAAAVRFTSRDNPTATARNLRSLFKTAQIDRTDTALWNAVPWRRKGRLGRPNGVDLVRAIQTLPELFSLLPELKSVILMGRSAAVLQEVVATAAPDAAVITTAHPSPTYVNTDPAIRLALEAAFAHAADELRSRFRDRRTHL